MPENNSQPYEIIAAPFNVYIAPVGTAFPLIDADPADPWALVGSSGVLNYGDEGVTVSHAQSITKFRSAGDAGSRKVFRTEEDLTVRLMLADLTLEQYRLALNSNILTTVPPGGEAGYKKIGLSRGFAVATVALLVKGPSPYAADMFMQYEIPRAAQSGNPEPVHAKKGSPAMLALAWDALVDTEADTPDEYFGRLIAMHLDPLS